ncbi:MAG: hypothetical protein AAFP19_17330 [Bacteroidota bacterium]
MMKKILFQLTLSFALLIFGALNTQAQSSDSTPSKTTFNNQTMVAQVGIGLGGYANTYSSQTPIISAAFEKAYKEKIGPGYLGIGGQIGYKSATYDYGSVGFRYNWKYRYTMLAARALYHPDFISIDNFDVYGGLTLGMYFLRFSSNDDLFVNYNSNHVLLGAVVGAKYYFTEQLAAYAELGYGLGYLNVGIAYKL